MCFLQLKSRALDSRAAEGDLGEFQDDRWKAGYLSHDSLEESGLAQDPTTFLGTDLRHKSASLQRAFHGECRPNSCASASGHAADFLPKNRITITDPGLV